MVFPLGNVINCISRLSATFCPTPLPGNSLIQTCRKFHTVKNPLCFKSTPVLSAEPLKKKKRVDPGILRMKEERKKKRIEKEIKLRERAAAKLKPIEELEVPKSIIQEKRKRKNPPLNVEETRGRNRLQKEWSNYKTSQHMKGINMINRIIAAQEKALTALEEESKELYQEALQIDPGFFPLKRIGPVFTPPIKNYIYPEGDYMDVTKKWC